MYRDRVWTLWLPPAYVVRGKVIFILGNVCLFTFGGGVPCLRFSGGSHVSDFFGGGVPGLRFSGGGPRSQIFRGLIHVQTGKKNFCRGTPPRNSKKLLWPRGGQYASCVHAGGLPCLINNFIGFQEQQNLSMEQKLLFNKANKIITLFWQRQYSLGFGGRG